MKNLKISMINKIKMKICNVSHSIDVNKMMSVFLSLMMIMMMMMIRSFTAKIRHRLKSINFHRMVEIIKNKTKNPKSFHFHSFIVCIFSNLFFSYAQNFLFKKNCHLFRAAANFYKNRKSDISNTFRFGKLFSNRSWEFFVVVVVIVNK